MMTQNDRIIRYMTIHGSITAIEALNELGIMRLASRISDLKSQGYAIDRKMVKVRNRYNEECYIARYTFTNETRKDNFRTIPGFEWVDGALDSIDRMIKSVKIDRVGELNGK